MRYLSYQIIFFLFTISIFAQSPHGDKFDIDCSKCHNADSWKVELTQITFDHSKTNFPLIGQHQNLDCKSCHHSLVFSKMDKDCFSCHKDIHQATVGVDCASCHTPVTWIVKDIVGLHQRGRFPLLGAHKTADCAQCHSGYLQLNFVPLNIDCYACHEQNYKSTQNPNHVDANFSTDCQDCHNINAFSWRTTNVDHSFFPLVGGHALPSCFSCHQQGGNFSGLAPDCYSCHQQNYEATLNPNHVTAGLPTTCNVCHNIYGWTPASFNHDITQFPLTGKHINVDCSNCHTNGYTGTPTDCYACHRQDYESVTDPNHVTSQFSTDCSSCHTTAGWEGATFNHNLSEFPLTGAHQTVDCAQCHSTGYTGTPTDCYACHQTNYINTTNPNHQTAGIPTTCAVCHSTIAWQPAAFDHNITEFPLTGAHQTVDCAQCHSTGYTGTPTDCYACHQTNYTNTTNPNHQTAGIPTTCAVCHSTTAWQPAAFDHNITEFPLTGAHQTVDCAQCHSTGYTGTPTDCYACHQTNYTNTTNPNHQTAGIPTTCAVCHSTIAWQPAAFDHNITEFPLTGAHQTVDCAQCHSTGYTGTPTDCYACHQTNYTNTTNPNHQTAGIPTTCAVCHSTTAWQPAAFDHNITEFPLTGAHLTVDCAQCHTSGYTGTPTDCYACHQTDYTNTTNPNHQTAGIPTTCAVCHSTTAWQPATFDHNFYPIGNNHNNVDCNECHSEPNYQPQCLSCHLDDFNDGHDTGDPTNCWACHSTSNWDSDFNHSNTNFPLTGAHVGTSCQLCHASGYQGTPTDCYACHQTDYQQSANPSHTSLALSTTCQMCHTTNAGWAPATFPDHNNYFQLVGAHLQINNCADCHQGNYNNTPNTCIGCHQNNYNGTTDPPHQTLNFSDNCLTCHTMNGWTPATFDHNFYPIGNNHNNVDCNECHSEPNYQPQCLSCHLDDFNDGHDTGDPTNCWACHSTSNWDSDFNHSNTNFPLTGAHVGTSCQLCHASGYQGTPTDCYACHQTDYQQSANPSHTSLALSTTCQMCHTTNAGWAPATFPDHNNYFQLVGAHLQINNCADCHQGNYNNTPNTCIGCHQNNYNGTTDPPHQTLNFSDNCLTCHTMNGWTPATFDHNFYPIGNNHNNVDCNECHSEPNYQPQCLSCHLDDFNDEHDPGDPTDCWGCHSTSNWDSDFNHSNTNFPLTGAHIGVSCQLCHASGYQGTPTECFACHETDYQQATNPNHTSLALSTTCQTCHTTIAGWAPATFPDHNNYFQLLGAHLQINNCADCHQGNYNNTPNTCIGCHQNDYNGTTDPPHQTLNFSDNCLTCHTMNGWTPATFNHNFFPIGNNHNNVDCNECHSQPNYQPQCLSCHLDDFNDEHDPGDPTDCWNCHGSSDWDSGFDHIITNFPLTGAHQFVDCAQCHKEDKEGLSGDCFTCHMQDYLKSVYPNHKATGISTDCVSCHTTNNWNSGLKIFDENKVF